MRDLRRKRVLFSKFIQPSKCLHLSDNRTRPQYRSKPFYVGEAGLRSVVRATYSSAQYAIYHFVWTHLLLLLPCGMDDAYRR
jgi:hypothetical protein